MNIVLSHSTQTPLARRFLAAVLITALGATGASAEDKAPVDTTPLAIEAVAAFPDLQWSGWQPDRDGVPQSLRPVLLTHAGDGSGRLFVAEQQGIVHAFRHGDAETKVFLDLREKVHYRDSESESGFLGLAFHPRFGENGELFVHYTTTEAPQTMVLSRIRVSKDNPDRADSESEEEILRVEHPYWNHKGGTICFGPDGMLYISQGDGGKGNDPHGNSQNLQTLLGKILRIDVDHRDDTKAYTIPADNPLVELMAANDSKPPRPPVRQEIWAYGLRNVWQMSFDRRTGQLWIADVGQDLWEEINLGKKGGNYGWNLREGDQPYSPTNTSTAPGFIDPLWQYSHDIGKSITGGCVYRGQQLPELDGHYLYADYVSGRLWGLKYDDSRRQVVANRPIPHEAEGLPVMAFGEDEAGEVYFTILTPTGKGIYSFRRQAGQASR